MERGVDIRSAPNHPICRLKEHRSDRCATMQSGIFEAEDTRRDRKACVEAKQVSVAGHPSDGENLKTSKTTLEGLVSLVIK
jgi:hypothetical protein